jgi:type VI secretion system protein VasD
MKKGLLLVCIALLISSCGLFKKDKPAVLPEPTFVALQFEASGNINPNNQGQSFPVFLRIYQLKSYSNFEDADFFSLYENDDQALGKELVEKKEILLKPNEKRTVFYEDVSEEVRTIGIYGLFREYGQAQWKAAAGVQKNKTNVIKIYVSGTDIIIK